MKQTSEQLQATIEKQLRYQERKQANKQIKNHGFQALDVGNKQASRIQE